MKKKLDSDEAIDYDYWEQLLRSLRVWKAKAKLRRVSQEIVEERLQAFRRQQAEAATSIQNKLNKLLRNEDGSDQASSSVVAYDADLDPQPLLKLPTKDKTLHQTEEQLFLDNMVCSPHLILIQRACANDSRLMNGEKSKSLVTCRHKAKPTIRSQLIPHRKRTRL